MDGSPAVVAVDAEVQPTEADSTEAEGLVFEDLCIDIAGKRILWDVSGQAQAGAVLAVMGSSGSGKTTLLNSLSGQSVFTSGYVTLNGVKLGKKLKRQISYVLQEDIFFPNLSLRETLRYSALLRLPHEIGFKAKLAKVEEIIKTLGLQDCAQTYVGNSLVRGLSGGEKKRTNIACELLTDPVMLLLDEPTSGLDSSSALTLMETLCGLARTSDKIIIASIHQPSSQIYHMFDNLLLLAKGKVAYFGPGAGVLDHFSSIGLHCTLHYNPADYIIEMATQEGSRKLLIGEDPPVQNNPNGNRSWRKRLMWWKHSDSKTLGVQSSDRYRRKSSTTVVIMGGRRISTVSNNIGSQSQTAGNQLDEVKVGVANEMTLSSQWTGRRKWPTPWYWQLLVLTMRTFRQSRHVILSKLNTIQTLLMAVLVSLLWFQMPFDERSIGDREGYIFFTIIYTNFFSFFVATFTFPSDHVVISKERRSGSYHLSAYYLAKAISELPLIILLPLLFFTITYWAAGINYFASFFAMALFTILSNLTGQGFGLMVGAFFMNLQRSLVAATLILLGMLLLGGFYVERFPWWLRWARYTSYISYAYNGVLYWGFKDLEFSCTGGGSMSVYEACSSSGNTTFGSGSFDTNETSLISGGDVLVQLGAILIPWYWNLVVVIAFGLLFRIGAYLCLRFLHRKR